MAALAVLNRNLAEAMAAAVLEATPQGFAMRWPQGIAKPERLLWPVARSAAELLAGDDLGRLKVCAGNDCGWMFLDTSRSGRRRWCEMEVCGSRAKMRRYHQRGFAQMVWLWLKLWFHSIFGDLHHRRYETVR